jgi:hypothetical protein
VRGWRLKPGAFKLCVNWIHPSYSPTPMPRATCFSVSGIFATNAAFVWHTRHPALDELFLVLTKLQFQP